MKVEKLHLVPQVILDVGASALVTHRSGWQQDNYIMRLEAVVEYCQDIIEKVKKENEQNAKRT